MEAVYGVHIVFEKPRYYARYCTLYTVGAEILERAILLERRTFAAKITNLKKKIHIFLFNITKIQAILNMIRKKKTTFYFLGYK